MYFFFLLLALLIISIILTIVHNELWEILATVFGIGLLIYSFMCVGAIISNSDSEKYRLKYDEYIHRLSEVDTYESEEKQQLYKDIYDYNQYIKTAQELLHGRWFNWAIENGYDDLQTIDY